MIKRIKEYFEYRRNVRTAKRALARMSASVLPAVAIISSKGADIVKFVANLVNEANGIEGERLVEMVLERISATLKTDNNRIVEVLTYIAGLEPEDIRKIIVHSVVETNPEIKAKEE